MTPYLRYTETLWARAHRERRRARHGAGRLGDLDYRPVLGGHGRRRERRRDVERVHDADARGAGEDTARGARAAREKRGVRRTARAVVARAGGARVGPRHDRTRGQRRVDVVLELPAQLEDRRHAAAP